MPITYINNNENFAFLCICIIVYDRCIIIFHRLSYVEVELTSEKENNNLLKQEVNDFKNMHKSLQDKYSSLLDQVRKLNLLHT